MNTKSKGLILASSLLVGAGVAVAAMSMGGSERGNEPGAAPSVIRSNSGPRASKMAQGAQGAAAKTEIGGKVAGFSLSSVEGKKMDVAWDTDGAKATVLIFTSARCPVSNAYNARFEALAKAYSGKKVQMIGLNSNAPEASEEIAAHAKKQNWSFPTLRDENNKIADVLGARVTPEAYVVDAGGTLRYWGRIDDSQEAGDVQSRDLANALDAILAGKAVATSKTAAFGCGIKRA